jgi:hypothetical protein
MLTLFISVVAFHMSMIMQTINLPVRFTNIVRLSFVGGRLNAWLPEDDDAMIVGYNVCWASDGCLYSEDGPEDNFEVLNAN